MNLGMARIKHDLVRECGDGGNRYGTAEGRMVERQVGENETVRSDGWKDRWTPREDV